MKLSYVRNDLIASVVVFLVAIPLCLGIALASGAPLFSGIIAGIIGGIVVGFLSDSHVSVSGPAAGMVAIVLASIAALGSFHAFLLAVAFAGIIQILIGILRAGFIADYVPANVIQGLLTAIGILIIIKQLPLAFGFADNTANVMARIKEAQQTFSIAPLIHLSHHINYSTAFIAIFSIVLLVLWDKIPKKITKILPGAIVVVVLAVAINFLFALFSPTLILPDSHLVNIPVNETFMGLIKQLPHPTFSDWVNPNIYLYAVVIAIVASLETLLNLEASQKMDPQHRYSSRNKELVAQGIGNTLSGLIGGLPITSVIVRTTVNIQSGSKTKLSAIIHGGFLLISLLLIPSWLNKIPLAALAAILIVTGYKLARVSLFKEMYKLGKGNFIPFITTVVAIVFTNLLVGVLIGLGVSFFFILRQNSRNKFTHVKEMHTGGEILRIILPQHLTFLNKASMVNTLKKIPENSSVILDATSTDYIDHDILDVMQEYKDFQANEKDVALNIVGLQPHYKLAPQTDFITATTLDVQSKLTPSAILKVLKEGNQRFVNSTPIHKDFKRQISATSKSQHPVAVILSCIDSRVPVEHVFDLNLGDVFVARVAGNIINPDIIASIEYACEVAGAKLILILGHRRCGAVTAACDDVKLGFISQLLEKLKPAILAEKEIENSSHKSIGFVDRVACINVDMVQQQLFKESDILQKLLLDKKVGIVGGMYDVSTGNVAFQDLRNAINLDKITHINFPILREDAST